jgi:hypothetical protein
LVTALGASPTIASEPAAKRFLGHYVFSGPRHAEMELRLERGQYVMMLAGGADPSAGPASPADCYIRAVGKMRAQRFLGKFAQVDTDTFSYSRRRAQAEQRSLEVEFTKDSARVTRADVSGYCGLGADFVGLYRRQR